VLASLAASRTDTLVASGDELPAALTGGYHVAFLVGALFALAGAAVGGALIRAEKPAAMHAEPEPAQP
jgi:hypothetical protein